MDASLTNLLPDSATFPGGVLHLAGHSVPELAENYSTPLYVFIHMDTIGWFF